MFHLAVFLWLHLCLSPQVQNPPSSQLEIVSFACTRAYSCGMAQITLVGTVRNRGASPNPSNTFRLRLHVLAGLDYVSGDTAPWAPAMEAGGTASFKWQVQPTSRTGPL